MKKLLLILLCLPMIGFSQSIIHVYFPETGAGQLCSIKIYLDDELLGKVYYNKFKTFKINKTGKHTIIAKSRCAFRKKKISISTNDSSTHYIEAGLTTTKMYVKEMQYSHLSSTMKQLLPQDDINKVKINAEKNKNRRYSIKEVTTSPYKSEILTYTRRDMKPVTGIIYAKYESGQLMYEMSYLEGKKHKDCREWYENGQLKSQGNFNMGLKVKEWKYFHEDGTLKYEEYLPAFYYRD